MKGGEVQGAIRFSVKGLVQGVGFRYSAIRQARALSLRGWVRNEEDGSVSGFAQGRKADLDGFADWLARGPAGAVVRSCEIVQAPPREGLDEFGLAW